MTSYSRDPRWIRAKFNSRCRCGKQITAGDEILYWPYNRSVQCEACGGPAWQRFLSESADEDVYNGRGGPYAS